MPLLGDFGGSIGNCKFLYMNPLLPWVLPSLFLCYSLYSLFFPLLVGCMHLLRAPSFTSCLQACIHEPNKKGKEKRVQRVTKREKGGALKAREGSIKNYKFLCSLQSCQGVV